MDLTSVLPLGTMCSQTGSENLSWHNLDKLCFNTPHACILSLMVIHGWQGGSSRILSVWNVILSSSGFMRVAWQRRLCIQYAHIHGASRRMLDSHYRTAMISVCTCAWQFISECSLSEISDPWFSQGLISRVRIFPINQDNILKSYKLPRHSELREMDSSYEGDVRWDC